ncbi:MAG: phosphotriesterase [Bryobacterales bacterium]|nr:phosphotriesterase [Bryobacterales bacterium]
MNRRDWIATAAASVVLGKAASPPPPPRTALVHEHVLVDFRPLNRRPDAVDLNAVYAVARPRLEEVTKLGCVRFQECTPAYLGRAPRLLRRLAEATGIEIWTNTGWYAARDRQFLPPEAATESAAAIAARWVREARQGVDGVKPGFVKIGVNRAPLHPVDRKMVEAAAICSRETGLTVASHTGGGGPAALEQLEIFSSAKADLHRFVWVHADSEKDHSFHERVARAGAWVEFDHVNARNLAAHLEAVRFMASRNLLRRTLISQDSGYYRPDPPQGGVFQPFTFLYTDFLPKLDPAWVNLLMSANPVAAFGGTL